MPNIINTTPHTIHIKKSNSDEIIEYKPSGLPPIRCYQEVSDIRDSIDDCIVIKSSPYILDRTTLVHYLDADVLIVSTIVANAANDIKRILPKNLRVLVPDSGPTAKRNENGQVDYVIRFIEY